MVTADEYKAQVEKVINFLNGKGIGEAKSLLESKMKNASNLGQFEIAIKMRDSLKSLNGIAERSVAMHVGEIDADVFGLYSAGDITVINCLVVRGGLLIGFNNYVIEKDVVGDVLSQFVGQYYLVNSIPSVLISATDIEGFANVEIPKIAYKAKLLALAQQNAKEYLEKQIEAIEFKTKFTVGACSELSAVLGLNCSLKRIECFDNSNTAGDDFVSSMVVFTNGVKDVKEYRRFMARVGDDEYTTMRETLKRRLAHGEWTRPDLIVLDGGKGQLSAVADLLVDYNFIAFSENNQVFYCSPTGEFTTLDLPKHSLSIRLLQRVRDEAHRFAITYQRKVRSKKFIKQA